MAGAFAFLAAFAGKPVAQAAPDVPGSLPITCLGSRSGPALSASRFGTVGKAPGFAWHRFYNAEWEHLESPPDPNRYYTLGKLEPRDEPGLEWCREASGLCFQGSLAVQRAIYERIFRFEKPRIAEIIAHHGECDSAPALRFVVGNEPNFWPYVDPGVFAGIYMRYRDYIRNPAPGGLGCAACRVNAGGILLLDPLGQASLAGALVAGSVGVWNGVRGWFGAAKETEFLPYGVWISRFLDSLSARGGKLDGLDVHVYAIDAQSTLIPGVGPALFGIRSDPAAPDTVAAMLRKRGGAPIWVGEFGSVHPFQDAARVVESMEAMVARFRGIPEVERWFWYAAAGSDPKFPGGRMRFGAHAWSFSSGPEVGLFTGPAKAGSRTVVGETYSRLQEMGR